MGSGLREVAKFEFLFDYNPEEDEYVIYREIVIPPLKNSDGTPIPDSSWTREEIDMIGMKEFLFGYQEPLWFWGSPEGRYRAKGEMVASQDYEGEWDLEINCEVTSYVEEFKLEGSDGPWIYPPLQRAFDGMLDDPVVESRKVYSDESK